MTEEAKLKLIELQNACRLYNKAEDVIDYIVTLTRFSPNASATKEEVVAMINNSASQLFDEIDIT